MSQDVSQKITELEIEVRVLREKLSDGEQLTKLRIEEMEKRSAALVSSIEDSKTFVERRARLLGITSVFGFPVAIVILIWVIYSTGKFVAEEAAREAARAIDWNEQVEAVANEEVKKLVTPEVLAKAIDDRAIVSAARNVLNSGAFQPALEEAVKANADSLMPSKQELANEVTKLVQASVNERIGSLREEVSAEVARHTRDLDPQDVRISRVA